MAQDLTGFSISHLGSVSVSVPVVQIECRIVNSRTRAELRDFTGANALKFPQILSSFTAAERQDIMEEIIQLILRRKLP